MRKKISFPKLTRAAEGLDEAVGNDQELLEKLLETFLKVLMGKSCLLQWFLPQGAGLALFSATLQRWVHQLTKCLFPPYNRI